MMGCFDAASFACSEHTQFEAGLLLSEGDANQQFRDAMPRFMT